MIGSQKVEMKFWFQTNDILGKFNPCDQGEKFAYTFSACIYLDIDIPFRL